MTTKNEARATCNAVKQNPPRKHHYLPIFYSKQWAGDDGQLHRFTRELSGLVERRVHPARVGWKYDLYKMPDDDGPDAQRMETRFFSRLDDLASRTLRILIAEPATHLNEFHVGHWIMFMRSLRHRSPNNLSEYQSSSWGVWQETLRKLEPRYSELRAPTDPETHAEYVRSLSERHGAARILETLPGILSSERVMKELAAAPWAIYNVPKNAYSLLLSDSPIVMTNGFHAANGHLAMPLSPRRFLLVARDKAVAERIDRMPIQQLVKSLNLCVVRQAKHFVAAEDLRQRYFIDRHFNP